MFFRVFVVLLTSLNWIVSTQSVLDVVTFLLVRDSWLCWLPFTLHYTKSCFIGLVAVCNDAKFRAYMYSYQSSHLSSDQFSRVSEWSHSSSDQCVSECWRSLRAVILEIATFMTANMCTADESLLLTWSAHLTACASFPGEAALMNFTDMQTGLPLKRVEEKCYFFRLSKYQRKLIDLIRSVFVVKMKIVLILLAQASGKNEQSWLKWSGQMIAIFKRESLMKANPYL